MPKKKSDPTPINSEQIIELVPVDDSAEGVDELVSILQTLIDNLAARAGDRAKDEKAFRTFLKEELARPKEERDRETDAIIQSARRRFRGEKDP